MMAIPGNCIKTSFQLKSKRNNKSKMKTTKKSKTRRGKRGRKWECSVEKNVSKIKQQNSSDFDSEWALNLEK